jgi:hypothetical protein
VGAGVRGTYRTLETSHRDGTRDAPTEGDLQGNGVPILVVRVTALKARTRRSSTGRRGTGGQTEAAMRYAKSGEPNGAEGHLLLRGDKLGRWRARVIRKRSRFVRRGAIGEGPLQDSTSPVAYSTWNIRLQKRPTLSTRSLFPLDVHSLTPNR